MSKKTAWENIYKDFRHRLPTLAKLAVDHRPYDYMTIAVYLEDGTVVLYNGLEKRARFSKAA